MRIIAGFGVAAALATEPAFSFPRPGSQDEESGAEDAHDALDSGALTPPKTSGSADAETGEDSTEGKLLAPRKKSFRRMQKPLLWSIGPRAGMWGNSGFGAQYIGEGENAWNIGINFMDADNTIGTALIVEMLWLYDFEWTRVKTPDLGKWKASRGQLLYFTGGGIQTGSDGIWPRIPFGMQITMREKPLTLAGQLTVMAGQIAGKKPGFTPLLAPEITVRYLLENP